MSPYLGEAVSYEVVAPTRGALHLHPSRVIRFLGNEWPDPSVGASVWSDSVLQTLYDAIHAVALTNAGATSLMHEAKVDVVTVPNLSEHLASSATTAQLSARFSYAAAMKSINNLLLLGDGETWSRQTIDFAGLPEMVRTFLQVAAGAADIPVTRLLGQSPAGLSATGDSDTRNYYDMIAARQAIDLRPKLERLDDLILRSAGVDPGQVSFDFRPLWQMDAATNATVALNKAQTTQIYAGLKLWPDAVTARLVQSQVMEDGTYPAAEAIFAAATAPSGIVADAGERQDGGASRTGSAGRQGQGVADLFDPNQPRDPNGRWTAGGGATAPAVVPGPDASQPPNAVNSALPQPVNGSALGSAPDGTPIEAAGFKRRSAGGRVRAIVGLLAGALRLLRGWPESDPDDDLEPPPESPPKRTPSSPSLSSSQTEKNKKAQAVNARVRSDLSDDYINADGTLKWPPDNGVTGGETPALLPPGQIVDKYGYVGGSFLAPPGTPYEARSLPYDKSIKPLQTFEVMKPLDVQQGKIAPWFGEPGGGTQFRTGKEIDILIEEGFLKQIGRSNDRC